MYIPVLKNRLIEMGVLKTLYGLPITPKIIPLVEVIQENSRSNSPKTFIDDLCEIFNKHSTSYVLIDILKTNIPKSTTDSVREFLTKVNRIPGFYMDLLLKTSSVKKSIPVVSYNPKNYDVQQLRTDASLLRKQFSRLAFRIKLNTFGQVFQTIQQIIKKDDLLILDIESASHTNPGLRSMYHEIKKDKSSKNYTTFIINANRPETVANKRLEDAQPILEIDNSLLEVYHTTSYGFDGFGDYACITDTLPTTGGSISPAGIYYSKYNNFFVGFKGRKQDLSEFVHIAQSIIDSDYWGEFDESHHSTCPGCISICDISTGKENGKNQAKWKGITMNHYIYTINESLK